MQIQLQIIKQIMIVKKENQILENVTK